MHTFKTWVDQWVDEERLRESTGRDGDADGTSGCRRRYPDDPPISPSGAIAVPTRGDHGGGFAGFWYRTRRRNELDGISLAGILALGGGWEGQAAGFLSIREDLPAAEYLAIPFVRRAWRFLWLLDDGSGVHFEVDEPAPPVRPTGGAETRSAEIGADQPRGTASGSAARPRLRAISVDWSVVRALDMEPRTAQYNLHSLMQVLEIAGFLDSAGPNGLSTRTQELLRDGSVGAFYKALLLRLFNRVPWETADPLGPISAIQFHGLYLTWLMTRSESGAWTPRELQKRLSVLARILKTPTDGMYWLEDEKLTARAVRDRFLRCVGRMLGLVELVPDAGAGDIDQPYRGTAFASRVLRWQE